MLLNSGLSDTYLDEPDDAVAEPQSPYLRRPLRSEAQARVDLGLCPWSGLNTPDIGPDEPCPVCGATEADADTRQFKRLCRGNGRK